MALCAKGHLCFFAVHVFLLAGLLFNVMSVNNNANHKNSWIDKLRALTSSEHLCEADPGPDILHMPMHAYTISQYFCGVLTGSMQLRRTYQ